jgi:hypothetical protein
VARLFLDQSQHDEAQVALHQETADPAVAVIAETAAARATRTAKTSRPAGTTAAAAERAATHGKHFFEAAGFAAMASMPALKFTSKHCSLL